MLFINDIGNIYNIFPLNPSFVQIIRKLGTYDLYHLITRIRKFLCPGFIQFIVIHHFLAAVDQKIIIKPCSRWQTDECTFFDPVFCDIWEIDFFYRCGGSNTDDVTVFYGLFHRITYDDLLNLRTFLLYELFKCMQGTQSSSFHFYRSNLRADA